MSDPFDVAELIAFLFARLDERAAALRKLAASLIEHSDDFSAAAEAVREAMLDVDAERLRVDFWSQAYRSREDYLGHDWERIPANARWTLQVLAQPFALHPDYRREWTP